MQVESPERPLTTFPTDHDLPGRAVADPGSASAPAVLEDAGPELRPDIHSGDGPAVASFVLGLVGLLVMNVILGPLALALGTVALIRGTERRGRALLGLLLGVADLVVLAVLMTSNGAVSWSFG